MPESEQGGGRPATAGLVRLPERPRGAAGDHVLRGGRGGGRAEPAGHHPHHPHAGGGGAQCQVRRAGGE